MTNNKDRNSTDSSQQPQLVTPSPQTKKLIENISTIKNLCIDINEDDDNSVLSEAITTPLDYRRDWSKDLEDTDKENEERPISNELYNILQNTIVTIDPYDGFSDDDISCSSLQIHVPSDIFIEQTVDDKYKKNNLLKALYHDRSHNLIQNDNDTKRRKLN